MATKNKNFRKTQTMINNNEQIDEEDIDNENDNDNFIRNSEFYKKRNEKLNKLKNRVKIYENFAEYYDGEVDEYFNRQGYGTYFYANDDVYEGNFEKGLKNGEGDYIFHEGASYRGEWENDKKNGFGSYKCDNFEFNGQWENDKFIAGFMMKISNMENLEEDELQMLWNDNDGNNDGNNDIKLDLSSADDTNDDDEKYVSTYCNKLERKLTLLDKISTIKNKVGYEIVNFNPSSDKGVYENILNKSTALSNNSDITTKNRNIKRCATINNDMFKNVAFKCKTCLHSENNINYGKCTCDNLRSYMKKLTSKEI